MATTTDIEDYTDLYNFVTSSGIIVPDTSSVKAGITQKFYDIFGSDLDVTEETPVGRLIEALTVIVQTALGVTAQNANQFNVTIANGIYLDSLAQIYGLTRRAGTHTRATITVTTTAAGCTIPAGTYIQNRDSYDNFQVENTIVVEANQLTATGTAIAVETGPIPADTGQLSRIVNGQLGWLSVTNEAATTIGQLVETDEEFRQRILSTRPIGTTFTASILSRINRLDDVASCVVYENNYPSDMIKNGVVIPGHSIFVCVSGGDDDEIVEAIAETKPPGTGFKDDGLLGSAEKVTKTYAGTDVSTVVTFYRPSVLYVYVKVTVDASLYAGSDITADVKSAVKTYFQTLGIGETAYSTKVSLAISSAIKYVSVLSLSISRTNGSDSYAESIPVYGYEMARVHVGDTGVADTVDVSY